MLTINLLPRQEKKEIGFEADRRIVGFFALFVSTILAIASSLLLPSFLPIYLERRELERSWALEQAASEQLKVSETVKRVKSLQSVLSSTKKNISYPSKASLILDGILERAGPSIALANITVRQGGAIALTGVAKTRRDLLNFEKALRDSGTFQDISSPISNIIREIDISFNMQGTLKEPFRL